MSDPNFDTYFHEINSYTNDLAEQLAHPGEKQRALIIWKAVMHTIRDRIQISESFDLMSQLPLILKGMYVDHWNYHPAPQMSYNTLEEMTEEVKNRQAHLGEEEFDWDLSTAEIISRTIDSLRVYLSDGQLDHVKSQLPAEVADLIG